MWTRQCPSVPHQEKNSKISPFILSNFRGVGKQEPGNSTTRYPVKTITSTKSKEHQKLINNLLRSTFVLTIKEICLLWVFKSKENLNAKEIEQLQIIANKTNIFPAIKANKLAFLGSANHD